MQIGGQRGSDNIEDRRGMGMVGGGLGIGGLVIAIIAMFMGVDPSALLNVAEQAAPQQDTRQAPQGAPADEGGQFVSKVLGSTEDVWQEVFRNAGRKYRNTKLVLFEGGTGTACGMGQSAMGPFYCPRDGALYIDLSFYRELRQRFHAPGDFAQAYVIAHEVGHHVQNQLGTMDRMQSLQGRVDRAEYNRYSVRLELQADCFAGVWAHHAAGTLQIDASDMAEGMNAAAAIGDDRLQKQTQGRVVPEAFTHGTSAQRQRWLRRGIESGKLEACDTFSARDL